MAYRLQLWGVSFWLFYVAGSPTQPPGRRYTFIHNQLFHLFSPSTTATLLKPQYRINVPAEFIKDEHQRHIVGNLLVVNGTGQPNMLQFQEILAPFTTYASEALSELKTCLTGTEARSETLYLTPECMPQRSIILMDNRRWLHAQEEVRDPKRHLYRTHWNAVFFPCSS